MQEIRFMKDGRTPISTIYRMGPGLFEYERLKKKGIGRRANFETNAHG